MSARKYCAGATCRPLSVTCLPNDPRTKLERRLRKKAASFLGETERLQLLPASSHPVARKLAAFTFLAKRFFRCLQGLSNPEYEHPVVAAQILVLGDQAVAGVFEHATYIMPLVMSYLKTDDATFFQMAHCS